METFEGFDPTVCDDVSFEFVGSVERHIAACYGMEWTLEFLIRFMDQHVPLEFVLAVKLCGADLTAEWFLAGVNENVRLEIVLTLELLVTDEAFMQGLGAVGDKMASQVSLTGEDLVAFWTVELV